MKIIINGCAGRMGRAVEALSAEGFRGAQVVAGSDPFIADNPAACRFSSLFSYQGEADCVVDFSSHEATAELLHYCLERKMPVVIATTGQTEQEKEMIRVAAEKIPVFYSRNMSLGIAWLSSVAKSAAAFFPDADIEIVEMHHNQKADAPSGTALMLAEAMREAKPEAELVLGRSGFGKRQKREIGISAIRLGNEVGTHEILISTGNETITLKHQITDRSLFANGALVAAAFLCGKPAGLYTMNDITG